MEQLSLGLVAHRFDVVPVRTDDESRLVVRVMVRAQPSCTIVFASRLQRRAIEIVDLLTTLGHVLRGLSRTYVGMLDYPRCNLSVSIETPDAVGWGTKTKRESFS